MKYVDSGAGKMPLITLIAILSVSLTVNLPGLAVSPVMSELKNVFPSSTEFEAQLLTVLPNLVIIPFMLLSGHLAVRRSQALILGVGLGIYLLAAVLYLLCSSIVALLVISCLLGVGAGLVIPLAGGYIGQYFTGKARVRFLGMKSGISNASIIAGTFFVGLVATRNWHLPFLVYLVPLIPLALMPFLSKKFIDSHRIEDKATVDPVTQKPETPTGCLPKGNSMKLLAGVIAIYFCITYGVEVVSYYLPFTFTHYHLSDSDTGTATSIFFLACTLGGFGLQKMLKITGRMTIPVFLTLMTLSLVAMGVLHSYGSFLVLVFVLGLGYGIIQPIVYDKATQIAPTPEDSSRFFSYVLTANYIAISLAPVIVDGMSDLFHEGNNTNFPYFLNGAAVAIAALCAWTWRRSFAVEVDAYSNC